MLDNGGFFRVYHPNYIQNNDWSPNLLDEIYCGKLPTVRMQEFYIDEVYGFSIDFLAKKLNELAEFGRSPRRSFLRAFQGAHARTSEQCFPKTFHKFL